MKLPSWTWSTAVLVTVLAAGGFLAIWAAGASNADVPAWSEGAGSTPLPDSSPSPAIPLQVTYDAHCVPLSNVDTSPGTAASGTVRFVSTTGSNSSPGTIDQPWRTIQFAANQVSAGDVICVGGGSYSESVYISRPGAQDAPIALSAYNGEAVTVDGGDFSAIHSPGHDSDYWDIYGLTLKSRARYALEVGSWDCVNAADCHGSSHWRIQNLAIDGAVFINGSHNLFESNRVDGSAHSGDENGVLEAGVDSHHNTYLNNEVHDFKERGFWSEIMTHNSLWAGNYVHDIWGDNFSQGIDLDGYKNVEWQHAVLGNRVERVSGLAIQLENTFASRVENNVIVSPRRQGIVVINYPDCRQDPFAHEFGGSSCVGAITNTIIRQNLIHGGADWGGIISYQAGGIQILGNTIAGIDGPCVDLRGGGVTSQIELLGNILSCRTSAVSMDSLASFIRDDYNLLNVPGSVYVVRDGPRYSLAEYRAVTGSGQGSTTADPLFVDASAGDFHLLPGSPAVDSGIDLEVDKDLDGNPRPQGGAYDMGAFELRQ